MTNKNDVLCKDGTELALDARDQAEAGKEVTVICPKCKHKPEVVIEGEFHERIIVRCPCNYVSMIQLGI